ncbi:MAG: serpin family protein [Prolixibacteraceae bacterium]|nr:serpin family protein [Prolixibacteraceae bacterium]
MKKIISILILSLILFVSCNLDGDSPKEIKKIELDEKSAQLIEADNEFGLELFQLINAAKEEKNLMISPLSVSVALAMAYNGAEGDTKTEMEQALKVLGLTTDEINASYEYLINALQSLDPDVVFQLANAIFYEKTFSVKSNFINTNKNVYDAEVAKLDFGSTDALSTINNWVADKTNDKIDKIIEQLDPQAVMVLLNAIYFNGIWTTEFDEDKTHERSFRRNNGTEISVPMMHKEDSVAYMTNDLFSAVRLPYGNGQYSMVVFLPKDENNSDDVIDNLSKENWKNWMNDFKGIGHVNITMPRFKYRFEMELNDVLKEMGMVKAFSDSEADFSSISDIFIYISYVIHKTFIDVNENGTEAAAVTAIGFEATSAGGSSGTNFYVDKPFVYAITEKDTGAIIFIGEVTEPVYEN